MLVRVEQAGRPDAANRYDPAAAKRHPAPREGKQAVWKTGEWVKAGRHTTLALAVWLLAACGRGSAPSPPAHGKPPPASRVAVNELHVRGVDAADGLQPNGPLLRARDGNFYGTTSMGGPHACRPPDTMACGTLSRVAPVGRVTLLPAFGATSTDG